MQAEKKSKLRFVFPPYQTELDQIIGVSSLYPMSRQRFPGRMESKKDLMDIVQPTKYCHRFNSGCLWATALWEDLVNHSKSFSPLLRGPHHVFSNFLTRPLFTRQNVSGVTLICTGFGI